MPGYTPPKPDGQRRRRNAVIAMTQLPAGGRKGPAPDYPFDDPSPRELHWWEYLWRKPQAAAWDKFELHTAVARYCVVLAKFEGGSFAPQVLSECRQLEDRLGLNPLSMLRLRWEVSEDEVAEKRAERPAKSRPKVVDPGAVAGS